MKKGGERNQERNRWTERDKRKRKQIPDVISLSSYIKSDRKGGRRKRNVIPNIFSIERGE